MAQFSHPELGGAGQWSQGGMTMIGDMFNQGLKRRVDALCSELADQVRKLGAGRVAMPAQSQFQAQGSAAIPSAPSGFAAGNWWPAELGTPASSGAQNDVRYAYFPAAHRLAIQRNGRLELFDTGDRRIFGVSQQQGGTTQDAVFSSDQGDVRLTDLTRVDTGAPAQPGMERGAASAAAGAFAGAAAQASTDADPLTLIERLAGLRQKGILTDEEFAAKKSELLARL